MSPQLAVDVAGRRAACRACRTFLNGHEDPQVRPRQRTATGAVAQVAEAVHRRAFLQHDLHAEPVMRFFLEHYGNGATLEPRGVLLTVFTRWDSAALPPSAVVIGRSLGADAAGTAGVAPPLELEMYCNSGEACVGYHYDPIFQLNGMHGAPGDGPPPPPQPVAPRPPPKRQRKVRNGAFARSASSANTNGQNTRGTDQGQGSGPQSPRDSASPPAKQEKSSEVQGAASEPEENVGYYELTCMPADISPDPRVQLKEALDGIAAQLREDPTLPADAKDPTRTQPESCDENTAFPLPPKHCAFKGCAWYGNNDAELLDHLAKKHHRLLNPAKQFLNPSASQETQFLSLYNEAIATKVREGAPTASYSIDRRCLKNYAAELEGNNIQCLICFSCLLASRPFFACLHC